ncbi:MAG TPA: chaperone NapD [Methylomirabilota bacterium]|nr:chaperone NapD [Methylomirabilota bacterium]
MRERSMHIISSAVVSVRSERMDEVVAALSAHPDTEVRAAGNNKIVIILEGGSRGAVGRRLTEIALMDGVIAANMVFEHVEEDEEVQI